MTQDKKEQWLKKFDEEYGSFELCEVVNQKDHDKLKSFLSSLIDDIDRDWSDRILEAMGEEKEIEIELKRHLRNNYINK